MRNNVPNQRDYAFSRKSFLTPDNFPGQNDPKTLLGPQWV